MPAGHPLADAPGLRLADLAAEPWIFGGSGPWSEITTAACEAAGFVPEQAHSASGWTAILAMVEAGMGIALVPGWPPPTAGAAGPGRHAGPLRRPAAPPRRRGGAERAEEGPAVAWMLAALRQAAAARETVQQN
ncbi:LysR substrate-binding domain-containing protein [Streptomyces diastatochromogenes]|nr:LysR substrate-binding domain-containing protein [Streptomyces diastatochromogenes]